MASRPVFKSDDLKDAIAKRGLTQNQLAALARLERETVIRAVAGKPVSAATARAIVDVLVQTPELALDLIEAGK